MANRRNVHAYDPSEIDRLKSVPVPAKIKCGRCQKNFPPTKYSTKQLTDLRYQIRHGYRPLKPINCQTCTGAQIVEIECTMCHKTKGLEEFAKCQRKPDTAKCFKCTDDQVTQQPINDERYEDSSNTFVTPDTSGGFIPDYWSSASSTIGSSIAGDHDWSTINDNTNARANGGVALSAQFQQAMSINGSVTETLIDSEYSHPARGNNGAVDGDGWSEVRTKSWRTASTGTASAVPSVNTGSSFDANRYGNPSAASRAGTQRTYASSVAERSAVPDARSNGWAKIPRGPTLPAGPVRSPYARPAGDSAREVEADTDVWSDSGDEDTGEDNNGSDDSDDSDGENTVI